MSKNPPIPKKVRRIVVTTSPYEFDSKSSPCMLLAVSGNLYLTGIEDATISNQSFKIPANTIFEFTGKIKLVSDSSSADVRILFYEYS